MTFIPGAADALGPIFVVFVIAALIALLLTPLVRRIVLRYEVVDHPEERRVNTVPVPRGGGLAVCAAFLLVSSAFLYLNQGGTFVPIPFTLDSSEVAALLLGGGLAAALGAVDDLFDLRARLQLLGQVGLALFAVALGITIDFVANPIGGQPIRFPPGPIAAGLTVFWIVGMINSINWIDGLDGLSSGIALIAAVTLGLISLSTQVTQSGQPLIAVLCFTLAGALLGFLRWNFNPASIFTGTSGVQFVGYTLAVLAVLGIAKVAVALLVLGVPIIDTFWIIVRRISQGRSPFSPDRTHIHHRLLDLGLSHRQTVLVIYGICLALALLSMLLSGVTQLYAFLGIFVAFGLVLFLPTRGDFDRPDELEAEAYEPEDPVLR
ncbi:MAG: glycosyltransferase family 4 protein [Chloroflexota bacterium]